MNALMIVDAHTAWAWFVVVTNGLAGFWSLSAHRWPALRSRALWWFTAASQATMLVQVILGVVTLVLIAPLGLSIAHQIIATMLLGVATWFTWRARRL